MQRLSVVRHRLRLDLDLARWRRGGGGRNALDLGQTAGEIVGAGAGGFHLLLQFGDAGVAELQLPTRGVALAFALRTVARGRVAAAQADDVADHAVAFTAQGAFARRGALGRPAPADQAEKRHRQQQPARHLH